VRAVHRVVGSKNGIIPLRSNLRRCLDHWRPKAFYTPFVVSTRRQAAQRRGRKFDTFQDAEKVTVSVKSSVTDHPRRDA
jgi:hypothetical protein